MSGRTSSAREPLRALPGPSHLPRSRTKSQTRAERHSRLTVATEIENMDELFVIDPQTCDILTSYLLPAEISGSSLLRPGLLSEKQI